MQLLAAHQILIGSAIALALLVGVRSLVLFARGGGLPALALGVAALALAGALGLYLRKVRARWAAEKRGEAADKRR
jgi:hypothetical protein